MTAPARPTALFWTIALLALVWNLFGLWSFHHHLTATPEIFAGWADPQQRIWAAMPRWLFVPFGIATIGGVLGALGLLLRRRWAGAVLLVSLLAIVVQFGATYLVTPAWALTGARGAVFPVVLALVALFLWRYARLAAARGWLRPPSRP